MKTLRLQNILIYSSLYKSLFISVPLSLQVKELIENDFHNLDFIPEHRNAYENAKFHSENFIMIDVKK
jgi:hypothetical protein